MQRVGEVDRELPSRPGPADRARTFEPLLRRTGGELSLGRTVELPQGPVAHAGHGGPLQARRAGRPGVDQQAKRVEPLVGAEVGQPQQAVQMGGNEEGGGGPQLAQDPEGGGRLEPSQDGQGATPQQRARSEADRHRVVHRRADQVQVVGIELPQVGLVVEDRRRRRLVPQAGRHPLGPAGRPRGVVHGPGEGSRGQVDRVATVQRGQRLPVEHPEHRLGVGQQLVPLGGQQGGIEEDRDHSDAGGAQDGAQQVGRRRQPEGHPVPRTAAGGDQRPGRPPLAVLGVRRGQELHHRGPLRHDGRAYPARPTWGWRTGPAGGAAMPS